MESNFYTIIDHTKLEQLLECLHICLGLHVQALDETGAPLCGFGAAGGFCMNFEKLLSKSLLADDSCRALHARAAMQALSLGEPYLFSCHAGLNHIVYPLVNDNTLCGSILVGPFLMEASDSDMISGISEQYSFSLEDSRSLIESASKISTISAQKAEEISRLLAYTLAPLISDGCRRLTLNRDRKAQPSSINDFIPVSVQKTDRNREVIRTAITYINENYCSPLTLSETATHVHLNASYFSTLFKQICGASFKEYLNCIRVEESKNLLSGTGFSILEIAVAVGFENQSYFTKVFKKYTGMTPKQYRN